MGDDTSDEHVVLLNKGTWFKAVSPGCLPDDVRVTKQLEIRYLATSERKERLLGHWSPEHGRFEGTGIRWVTTDRTAIREAPKRNAPVVETMAAGDPVVVMEESAGWAHVQTLQGSGWVRASALSNASLDSREFH